MEAANLPPARGRRLVHGEFQWPTMSGEADTHARRRLQPFRLAVTAPSEETISILIEFVWQCKHDDDLATLQLMLAVVYESCFPLKCKSGLNERVRHRFMAHVSAAAGMARLSKALQQHRRGHLPRWVGRFLRIAPPWAREGVSQKNSNYEVFVKRVIDNTMESDMTSVIYTLQSHSGQYVGKANLLRAHGRLGYPARHFEHVLALLRPLSRDGALCRYKVLRKSIGSVFMLPVVAVANEGQCYAIETLIIQSTRPEGNNADEEAAQQKLQTGASIKPAPVRPRKRPHRRFREVKAGVSMWTLPVFLEAARQRADQTVAVLPEVLRRPGCFRQQYREEQQIQQAKDGTIGPVWLFHHYAVFLSYAASKRPWIRMPPSWSREMCAAWLYGSGEQVNKWVKGLSARLSARRTIDWMLKVLRLPPLTVPPMKVPSGLHAQLHVVRRLLRELVDSIRTPSARVWITKHLRIVTTKNKPWNESYNCKAVVAMASSTVFEHQQPVEVGHAIRCRGIRSVDGPWSLGRWPVTHEVKGQILDNWHSWTQQCQLHPRIHRRGKRFLQKFFQTYADKPQPDRWRQLEQPLREAVEQVEGESKDKGTLPMALMQDDRQPGRAWMIPGRELICHLFHELINDTQWEFCPQFSVHDLFQWQAAKAKLGLPSFLQRWPRLPGREIGVPTIFAFVKSKCWQTGVRTCQKAGHSCWRRVLDMATVIHVRGWKVMARATRGVVASLPASHEVPDMAAVRDELRHLCCEVGPPLPHQWRADGSLQCLTCAKGISNHFHCLAVDIDQAFEACDAAGLGPEWVRTAARYTEIYGECPVHVQKGKACKVQHGRRKWSRASWAITLDAIHRAVVATTSLSLVAFGSFIFRTLGISIGGTMSSACVAVHLGDEEYRGKRFLESPEGPFPELRGSTVVKQFSWRRYVDDVLSVSRRMCTDCQKKALSHMYKENLSVVYESPDILTAENMELFTWLDLSIGINKYGLFWIPRNANRAWIWSPTAPEDRPKPVVHPWPGVLATPFGRLRAIILGKCARAYSLDVGTYVESLMILEALLELVLVGYPYSLIRAITHSIPTHPAARLARQAVRAWRPVLVAPATPGDPAMGRGRGRGGASWKSGTKWHGDARGGYSHWEHREYDRRDYDRKDYYTSKRRRHSPRPRSPSSSLSDDERRDRRREDRVKQAQRVLTKHDPNYKKMVEKQAKEEQDKQAHDQGAAIILAVKSQFDKYVDLHKQTLEYQGKESDEAVIPASTAPGPPGTPQSPPRPPGPSAQSSKLAPLQLKLANAELDHLVNLKNGDKNEFVNKIMAVWNAEDFKTRKLRMAIDRTFKNYKVTKIPRGKDARVGLLWDLFSGQ